MTALAKELRRIWSAKNRVPHLTGWGTAGPLKTATAETTLAGWAREQLLDLIAIAHRTAPTVIVVALYIFR
jgi:hypothetical protein